MDNFITNIIENLVNINIEDDMFRIILILIISIFFGIKAYGFKRNYSFKLKTKKYEYIRKMFFDYKSDKRSFFFSVQEYLGIALEEKEVDYLTKNNFYFFSRHLRQAYNKITFKNDGYRLKHPFIGALWAIIFYILTFVPTLFYLFHITDIGKNLSHDSFIALNIMILPIFIILSIISFYNLNVFGSAISICDYKKKLTAHNRIPPAPANLTMARSSPQR
jgi:hypothetical protein